MLYKRIFVCLLSFLMVNTSLYCFELQGHRGTRGLLPENSIPSFAAAIEAGADAIELDVLVTKDDQLVVHHDFFLNDEICTYLDGSPIIDKPLIRDLTLSEIKQIDCGSKQNPKFPRQKTIPGTQIPTLQEVFELFKTLDHPNAKNIRLNIELKVSAFNPEWTISPADFARLVVAEVNASGLKDRIYYSSFHLGILSEIRKLDPEIQIAFIFEKKTLKHAFHLDPNDWLDFVITNGSALQIDIISPNYKLLTHDKVNALHTLGFTIIPWTVNEPQEVSALMEMGVDGVITDYIEEIKNFVQKVENYVISTRAIEASF